MLTAGIRNAFTRACDDRRRRADLRTVIAERDDQSHDSLRVGAALLETDVKTFLSRPELSEEMFGPATLLVTHSDMARLVEIAAEADISRNHARHSTDVGVPAGLGPPRRRRRARFFVGAGLATPSFSLFSGVADGEAAFNCAASSSCDTVCACVHQSPSSATSALSCARSSRKS